MGISNLTNFAKTRLFVWRKSRIFEKLTNVSKFYIYLQYLLKYLFFFFCKWAFSNLQILQKKIAINSGVGRNFPRRGAQEARNFFLGFFKVWPLKRPIFVSNLGDFHPKFVLRGGVLILFHYFLEPRGGARPSAPPPTYATDC